MTKRVAVGPKNRRGYKIHVDGKLKVFLAGELLPEGTVVPRRFFRDKRVVWVEDEPVKKARPKPAPTEEAKTEKPATPVPEETSGEETNPPADKKKTKRKRKKLFSSGSE